MRSGQRFCMFLRRKREIDAERGCERHEGEITHEIFLVKKVFSTNFATSARSLNPFQHVGEGEALLPSPAAGGLQKNILTLTHVSLVSQASRLAIRTAQRAEKVRHKIRRTNRRRTAAQLVHLNYCV